MKGTSPYLHASARNGNSLWKGSLGQHGLTPLNCAFLQLGATTASTWGRGMSQTGRIGRLTTTGGKHDTCTSQPFSHRTGHQIPSFPSATCNDLLTCLHDVCIHSIGQQVCAWQCHADPACRTLLSPQLLPIDSYCTTASKALRKLSAARCRIMTSDADEARHCPQEGPAGLPPGSHAALQSCAVLDFGQDWSIL